MGESVNGEIVTSKTLSHITSYPLVADSISTFKSNPYGAKSIEVADAGYSKLVAPTLPYFKKPYSFVSPYVTKADELGDNTLGKIDSKFPVVKSETKELKDTAVSYAHLPLVKFDEGKKYLLDTYSAEYKKCGGEGIIAYGKAAVTTSLVTTSDVLTWLSKFISTKKAEAKEVAKEKTSS